MRNLSLKTQCEMLIGSLELFQITAKSACLYNDGVICRTEEKFLRKLDSKISGLVELLSDSP